MNQDIIGQRIFCLQMMVRVKCGLAECTSIIILVLVGVLAVIMAFQSVLCKMLIDSINNHNTYRYIRPSAPWENLEAGGRICLWRLPWYDSPTAQPCRAVASRQPHFGRVPLMGVFRPAGALFGICFLLCRGSIAFHPCLLSAVTP